jgi:hypothetical protein
MLAIQQPLVIAVDRPGLSETCLHPGLPTLALAAATDVPQDSAPLTIMSCQSKGGVDGPRDQLVAAIVPRDGSSAGGSGKGISVGQPGSRIGSKAGSATAIEGLTLDPKPPPRVSTSDSKQQQAGYSTDAYWNDRYAERNTHFDWFFTYSALQQLICATCSIQDLPLLHVGCGNSGLSEGMARDGFEVTGGSCS